MVYLYVYNGLLYIVENVYSVYVYNELMCIVFFIFFRVFKYIVILIDKLNEVFNELKLFVFLLYVCFII